MMHRTNISIVDRGLATLGLVLIGVIGWAGHRLSANAVTGRIVARVVLALVSAIGWLVDRVSRRDGRIASPAVARAYAQTPRPS